MKLPRAHVDADDTSLELIYDDPVANLEGASQYDDQCAEEVADQVFRSQGYNGGQCAGADG